MEDSAFKRFSSNEVMVKKPKRVWPIIRNMQLKKNFRTEEDGERNARYNISTYLGYTKSLGCCQRWGCSRLRIFSETPFFIYPVQTGSISFGQLCGCNRSISIKFAFSFHSSSPGMSPRNGNKFRELSLNFSKLADWLCISWQNLGGNIQTEGHLFYTLLCVS